MKIGLFFGSFNPFHSGHLIIANTILNTGSVEKIWFVVSPQNPFKQAGGLADEKIRLEMVNAAVEKDKRLKCSGIEFEFPRPSYTITTLQQLQEKYHKHQFSLIVGSDSYEQLPSWKEGALIAKMLPIIVYQRPGHLASAEQPANVSIVSAPLLDISSTTIRALVATGKSIRYLVPEPVNKIIRKKKLYRK